MQFPQTLVPICKIPTVITETLIVHVNKPEDEMFLYRIFRVLTLF
jgi:hypothetical protein